MNRHEIATVINFCTNDWKFLKASIEESQKFSKQIVVSISDHFFDGKEENHQLLQKIYKAFPEVDFLQYPFIPQKIPKRIFKKVEPAHFWHSLSRLLAVKKLHEEIEYVLFLDADEVPSAKEFIRWLDTGLYRNYTCLKLANYWYFRSFENQATKWEDSISLVRKTALTDALLLDEKERDAFYLKMAGPKRRNVVGEENKPMFHHYSWVRSKEEMLKKVLSWGHSQDRNWESLVHKEFEGPFSGTDFVHGYSYRQVKPSFDFSNVDFIEKEGGSVTVLSEKETLSSILQAIPCFFRRFW